MASPIPLTNKELHAYIESVVKKGAAMDEALFDRGNAGDEELWDGREAWFEGFFTPLTHCIRGSWRSGNEAVALEVIKKLVAKGASLNKPCTFRESGNHITPIHLASRLHLPNVQEFLEGALRKHHADTGEPIRDLLPSVSNEWFIKMHHILETDWDSPNLTAPAKITENLYLGNLKMARDAPQKYPYITAILSCLGTDAKEYHISHGHKFHGFRAEDEDEYPLLDAHYDEAAEFISSIADEGGAVLVHCFAGVNRSAAICVAYLVRNLKWPLTKALSHAHSGRPIILSNTSFREQLVRLAQEDGLLH